MKVEQAKQIASNTIEQLRQGLEAGHNERLKEYLAAMARFRRYSWGNVMLKSSTMFPCPVGMARSFGVGFVEQVSIKNGIKSVSRP